MIVPAASQPVSTEPNDNKLLLQRILTKLQETAIAIHEMADQDYELEDSLEEALEKLEEE